MAAFGGWLAVGRRRLRGFVAFAGDFVFSFSVCDD
jgi:hypothetical protein